MYRIGIDLGGTNIAVGVVDETGAIIARTSAPTALPRSAESLTAAIHELVSALLKQHQILPESVVSAGIGIPGTVTPDTGVVEYANNFGFTDVPLTQMLQQTFPFPLKAANDAKAAAWGEYRAGAGAGVSSMLMITLGTGVGGAMICNGQLIDGYNAAAGEIGHMVIERNGKACTCGRKGCFEAYASATALTEDARETVKTEPESLLWSLCGGEPGKLNGRMVFEAAEKKDPAAEAVLDRFLTYLAEGTANLINIFQPELVCIGGGLSGAGEALLAPLRERVAPLLYSRDARKNARIAAAALGNDAGIIGAAFL